MKKNSNAHMPSPLERLAQSNKNKVKLSDFSNQTSKDNQNAIGVGYDEMPNITPGGYFRVGYTEPAIFMPRGMEMVTPPKGMSLTDWFKYVSAQIDSFNDDTKEKVVSHKPIPKRWRIDERNL